MRYQIANNINLLPRQGLEIVQMTCSKAENGHCKIRDTISVKSYNTIWLNHLLVCNVRTCVNGRLCGCERVRFIPFRPAWHFTDFRLMTKGHGLASSLCKQQAMPGVWQAKTLVFHSSMEIKNLVLTKFFLLISVFSTE